MNRIRWTAALALSACLAIAATVSAGGDGFKPLFNGKNLDGWKIFLDPKAKNADTSGFAVKDGEIQLSGFPNGFIYTEKSFKNYVLQFSWTYPKNQPEKTTMNSGCLVHIQEPLKIWPKSAEPQGRYKDHGKIFFIGFDKGDKSVEQTFDEAAQKKALKAPYEWNTTEIHVKNGAIEVKVNNVRVTTGKCPLVSGPIGFQSEGARIHFKNIKIKALD